MNISERMGEPRRAWLMMAMRRGGCRRVDSAQSEANREDVHMGAFRTDGAALAKAVYEGIRVVRSVL